MKKITTFLWFEAQAEEAANFYASIFKGSTVSGVNRFPDTSPVAPGQVMSATFSIDGQDFVCFNGGPHYKLSPAVSMFVNCESQEEVDEYWNKLVEGGVPSRCSWLTDKYGLSWQLVPSLLMKYMSDKDREKAGRVMEAMLKMDKIIIKDLQDAYDGK